MTIALFEDNPEHAARLVRAIQNWGEQRGKDIVVKHFSSVFSAKDIHLFDCLFLDVEMPGISGLDYAKEIRQAGDNVPIVFVSSHTEYSIDGYEVSALRFLDKSSLEFPQRLSDCLEKISFEIESSRKASYIIKVGPQFVRLSLHTIFYFEIYDHDLIIHSVTGDYRERKPITKLEKTLPEHFVRVGRAYIVNMLQVQTVTTKTVTLRNGVTLPVTPKYSNALFEAYLRFQ